MPFAWERMPFLWLGGTGFSYALKGRSGALGYFTVGRITPMALSAESRTESATQPHPHHSHVGARPARDSRAGPAPTGSREARYFSVADLVRDGRTYRRGSRMRSAPTLPHPRHSHVGARPARDSRAGPAYGSRKHGRRSNCLAGCTEMRLNGWVEPWRNPCGRGDGYRFAQRHPTKSHALSCGRSGPCPRLDSPATPDAPLARPAVRNPPGGAEIL